MNPTALIMAGLAALVAPGVRAADAALPPGAALAPRAAVVSYPGYQVSLRRYRPAIMHDPQAMIRLPEETGPVDEGARSAMGLMRGRGGSPIEPEIGSEFSMGVPSAKRKPGSPSGKLSDLLSGEGDAAAAASDRLSESDIQKALGGASSATAQRPAWVQPPSYRQAKETARAARDDADESQTRSLFSDSTPAGGALSRSFSTFGNRAMAADARGFQRDFDPSAFDRAGRSRWSDAGRSAKDAEVRAPWLGRGAPESRAGGGEPWLTPRGGMSAAEGGRPPLYSPVDELRRGSPDGLTTWRPLDPSSPGGDRMKEAGTLASPWGREKTSADIELEPETRGDGEKSLRDTFRGK